ncbi:acyl-homoserine-lactone synthase [Ralstonia nicotianae]|uniref:acyl-homoserine-lactone synthase n=1 Tax=Ralstonia pseudosolanacearum TaxID=1310165 RepID=UPI002004A981|nr:acyl-homoserine-lactone synthase [Ralstonia pseudosolanacearum]MCK4120515.1 N-acylhomoserine lactone synthase [Ralstonia pseudosolanacearum]
MNFVSGKAKLLDEEILAELGRYRYRVFVEMLGWNLRCPGNDEKDQFDGPDTFYVIGRDSRGGIGAVARLLPTDRPYLLRGIFPQLMAGAPLPNSNRVWELSRFAAVDLAGGMVRSGGQFSSKAAVELMHEVLRVSVAHQVERLITVSPVGVERLLNHAGFDAYPAFAPVDVNGMQLFACWINVCAPQPRDSAVRTLRKAVFRSAMLKIA